MNYQELEAQIKEMIAKDEIETAIKVLTRHFQKDERLDEIILQSGRYFSLRKEQQKGTLGFEEVNKSLNQLRANILDFLRSEEEEEKFKEKVFSGEDADEDHLIPVFLSLGSPHTAAQVDYIEKLKQHLRKYDINLITLNDDDWDNLDPLRPIRKKMAQCHGCLSLAMERYFMKDGLNKRGSKQEAPITNQGYSTPWIHIEATLAYQLELPFLILKEKDLKSEGMIDDNLFEWRIVKIDPANPDELNEYPIKSFMRMWVEEVKRNKEKASR